MINLRSEKGSITLFVLVSCMFFIASVACVQIYMQSKQTAVDREFRQIKDNYEGNSLDENNLKESYEKILKQKNIEINIINTSLKDESIIVEFNVNDVYTNLIKYGWAKENTIDKVSKWTYIEKSSSKDNMLAIYDEEAPSGDYYLFIMINDFTKSYKVTI